MRIGVNALYLLPGQVGGTEIYLRGLLSALAQNHDEREYVVFLNQESAAANIVPVNSRFLAIVTAVRAANRPARLIFEQMQLPQLCRRHRLDVLLNAGFTGPWFSACPAVSVVHDLQFRDRPEFFTTADRIGWRMFIDPVLRRSARLLTVSQFTKRRLMHYYRVNAERIDVVWSAIDEQMFQLVWRPDETQPYFLTVSTLHRHKNLERLLRAFSAFRKSHSEARLIVAGLAGSASADLEALRASLGLNEAVEFTHWIPRERLLNLFAGARAFIFPSRYEGFGFPPLEAMALGIPTVCSDIPVLQETCGDAVLRFETESDASLLDAMERVWTDAALRLHLTARARERATIFRWQNTAAGTLQSLERAVQKAATSRKN